MGSRLGAVTLLLTVAAAVVAKPAPHVVVMLADDLGYHNVGWHGNPEVRTPTLDALARGGVRLERHYTFKYCR